MLYPNTQSLTEEQLKVLCDEYRKHNCITQNTTMDVKRGLRNADGTGVLAGLTNICDVVGYQKDSDGNIIPADGHLLYRGIDLYDIVNEAVNSDRFLFEEVEWLLFKCFRQCSKTTMNCQMVLRKR